MLQQLNRYKRMQWISCWVVVESTFEDYSSAAGRLWMILPRFILNLPNSVNHSIHETYVFIQHLLMIMISWEMKRRRRRRGNKVSKPQYTGYYTRDDNYCTTKSMFTHIYLHCSSISTDPVHSTHFWMRPSPGRPSSKAAYLRVPFNRIKNKKI